MSSIIAVAIKRHTKHRCLAEVVCASFASRVALQQCRRKRASVRVVSVLDLGAQPIARQAAETLRDRLRSSGELSVADADMSRAAAKGIGYSGSLNLSASEARDLGAALATEFYIIGDAQTLRRSSFQTPVYYESYCSIFLVSTRTGKLIFWDRPSFENSGGNQSGSVVVSTSLRRSFYSPSDREYQESPRRRTNSTNSFAGCG